MLRKVWQISPEAGINVEDVYVNYLRRMLGAASAEGVEAGAVIETVRGEGCRMGPVKMAARAVKYPVSAAFVGA